MFNAYLEPDIFETLVINSAQTPNWHKILSLHSKIYLNLSAAELATAEVDNNVFIQFVIANGGRSLEAAKPYFDAIYLDNAKVVEKPRAAFFLNVSEAEATAIQTSFGVIVQSHERIEDNLLRGTFFKDLKLNEVYENATTKGWKNLISFPLPPSNSFIVTDDYLFSNEENNVSIGEINMVQIADAFLPDVLDIPFHIVIVSNDQPDARKPARSAQWCADRAANLKAAIAALRPYPVVIEIVFTKTIHKRRLISNYIHTATDKGYSVFKVGDKKTVREANEFRCDRIFNRIDIIEGDSDFLTADSIIKELKKKCDSVMRFITNSPNGAGLHNRIVGDHNANYSLKNRLINDV